MDNANQAVTKITENNTSSDTSKDSQMRYCSQCRNHGLKSSLKGHKKYCLYRTCVCELCILFCNRVRKEKILPQLRSTMSRRTRPRILTQNKDLISLSIDGSSLSSGSQSVKNIEGSCDSNNGDLSVSNHESNETHDGNNEVTRITSSNKAVSSNNSRTTIKSWLQMQTGTDSNVSWDVSSTSKNDSKLKTRVQTCRLCRNHNVRNLVKGHKWYCPYQSCTCRLCRHTLVRRKESSTTVAVKRALTLDEKRRELNKDDPSIGYGHLQQINRLPIISQRVLNTEGNYGGDGNYCGDGNYGGDGINNLINTATPRNVPLDTIMPPFINSAQPQPCVNVEISLARSITLLQQFRYPWDILTLMYVTVKYAGADIDETLRRIDEVEHWILDVYFMIERYIKKYILFVLYKIFTIYTSFKLNRSWNIDFSNVINNLYIISKKNAIYI